MATLVKEMNERNECRYFKEPREKVAFYKCAVFFIFALYVMPQYFGIPNPIFDLTIVRISVVFLLILIFFDYNRTADFLGMVRKEKMTKILIPYIFVLVYTMVLRADANAFLNPFIEILEMYLLMYVIRDTLGLEKTIKLFTGFIYFLVILGFFEAFIKVSPFSFLKTIDGIYTGRYVRGGHYRIMSSCSHSLGYGLLLVTALPFAGYDSEKNEYNIFKRPFLLMGLIINVFLTGSRSSLGVLAFELALMFILSDMKYTRENIVYVIIAGISFAALLLCTYSTNFGQYIMLQITSLIDSFFYTSFSAKYGANLKQLSQSAAYRDLLKEIFKVDWLNPILGIGRKRAFRSMVDGRIVKSIDNFYIAEFVRYAYPGMITYVFFLIYTGIRMIKDMIVTRSAIIRMVFIGTASYCIHLYIADSLQTLKYLYVLFAIYLCCDKERFVPKAAKCRYIGKRESRYVKK